MVLSSTGLVFLCPPEAMRFSCSFLSDAEIFRFLLRCHFVYGASDLSGQWQVVMYTPLSMGV